MSGELTLFVVAQVCLLLGFAVGRITSNKIISTSWEPDKKSPTKSTDSFKLNSVKINDSTFVTSVADSSLAKMGKELGQNSLVDDDIGLSVSKLAQLKKNK